MSTSIFEAFNDPQMRHAALVHMPIALAILGIIPAAVALIAPKLGRAPVVVTIIVYLLLIGASWAGVLSGEVAYGEMGNIPPLVHDQAHDHEELAEKIWYFALAAAVFSLAALAKQPKVALVSKALVLLIGLGCAGWTANVAHLGGSLVYDFGVGVARPVAVQNLAPIDELTGKPVESVDPTADPRVAFFLANVRPTLADRCMGCHTRDDEPEADLDLSTPGGLFAGGENGPVIVPGDPAASSVYTSATGEHPELRMPKTGKRLTTEQIESIRQWIVDGAVWAEASN